jgi:hypothetical protein
VYVAVDGDPFQDAEAWSQLLSHSAQPIPCAGHPSRWHASWREKRLQGVGGLLECGRQRYALSVEPLLLFGLFAKGRVLVAEVIYALAWGCILGRCRDLRLMACVEHIGSDEGLAQGTLDGATGKERLSPLPTSQQSYKHGLSPCLGPDLKMKNLRRDIRFSLSWCRLWSHQHDQQACVAEWLVLVACLEGEVRQVSRRPPREVIQVSCVDALLGWSTVFFLQDLA